MYYKERLVVQWFAMVIGSIIEGEFVRLFLKLFNAFL